MYSIQELKKHIKGLAKDISENGIAQLAYNPENQTNVYITSDFIRKCKKGKVWNTTALLSALQNCWYGVDVTRMKSSGGKDGIFVIDRNYKPQNEMQRKIFDQFIDKGGSFFKVACEYFDKKEEEAIAVRIVSHHMRLLGVLFRNKKEEHSSNHIVLTD